MRTFLCAAEDVDDVRVGQPRHGVDLPLHLAIELGVLVAELVSDIVPLQALHRHRNFLAVWHPVHALVHFTIVTLQK